jgi:hypothetical protein
MEVPPSYQEATGSHPGVYKPSVQPVRRRTTSTENKQFLSAPLLPTPMAQLRPQGREREQIPPYALNEDNQLVLKFTPTCFEIIFMPFCCIGCCISSTLEVVFDHSKQTVTWSHYCGFMCCFKRTEILAYDQIGNIAFKATNRYVNDVRQYKPVLVMKNRETFDIGEHGDDYEAGEEALRLHRFFFGYKNSKYNAPSWTDLEL